MSNRGRGGVAPINNGGAYWHSDITYEKKPPMGPMLYGITVPRVGGNTLFADMTAAYVALDNATKKELEGQNAIHSCRYRYEMMVEAGVRPPQSEKKMAKWHEIKHPTVRTHPETGRKALFINEGFTSRISSWPKDESDSMLKHLYSHCTSDQFLYTHHWEAGDFVLWDNGCTMHCATPYDLNCGRTMHGATIRGKSRSEFKTAFN